MVLLSKVSPEFMISLLNEKSRNGGDPLYEYFRARSRDQLLILAHIVLVLNMKRGSYKVKSHSDKMHQNVEEEELD